MTESLIETISRTGWLLLSFLKYGRGSSKPSSIGCPSREIFLSSGIVFILILGQPNLRLFNRCCDFLPALMVYYEVPMIVLDILGDHYFS